MVIFSKSLRTENSAWQTLVLVEDSVEDDDLDNEKEKDEEDLEIATGQAADAKA